MSEDMIEVSWGQFISRRIRMIKNIIIICLPVFAEGKSLRQDRGTYAISRQEGICLERGIRYRV